MGEENPQKWSMDDVQIWLQAYPENVRIRFRKELVDGEVLLSLSENDLEKLLSDQVGYIFGIDHRSLFEC